MDLIGPDVELLGVAAAIIASADWTGPKLHLGQNDFTPTRTTVLADFVEATYDSYSALTVTWEAPSIADDGSVEVIGTVAAFIPAGSVTPNTIFTAYLTNSLGGVLLLSGRFDNAPLPMGAVTDRIIVTIRYRPFSGGVSVVVS